MQTIIAVAKLTRMYESGLFISSRCSPTRCLTVGMDLSLQGPGLKVPNVDCVSS